MKTLSLLAACLLLATPAFAQPSTTKAVNTAAGGTVSTREFVQQVAMSDMYEIQSSQLAAERGDAATKTFANQMIADHQKTSSELKSMAQSGGSAGMPAPPAALDQKHQKMVDKLKGLSGTQLSKQYQADQVAAHKEAVALFDRYARSGDNAELKAWAAKTLPTLQQHLQMAQNMGKGR
jgi:putative membrane protein